MLNRMAVALDAFTSHVNKLLADAGVPTQELTCWAGWASAKADILRGRLEGGHAAAALPAAEFFEAACSFASRYDIPSVEGWLFEYGKPCCMC